MEMKRSLQTSVPAEFEVKLAIRTSQESLLAPGTQLKAKILQSERVCVGCMPC